MFTPISQPAVRVTLHVAAAAAIIIPSPFKRSRLDSFEWAEQREPGWVHVHFDVAHPALNGSPAEPLQQQRSLAVACALDLPPSQWEHVLTRCSGRGVGSSIRHSRTRSQIDFTDFDERPDLDAGDAPGGSETDASSAAELARVHAYVEQREVEIAELEGAAQQVEAQLHDISDCSIPAAYSDIINTLRAQARLSPGTEALLAANAALEDLVVELRDRLQRRRRRKGG